MKILSIETSCDETAAAVVEDGITLLSSSVASSTAMHEKYGGVVPEIAAREQLRCIIPVITDALTTYTVSESSKQKVISSNRVHSNNIKEIIDKNIDAVAVTIGPGLIGSLLIGVETAKTISFVTGKPIIPVNHVLAHMYANFIVSRQPTAISREQEQKSQLKAESRKSIAFPAVSLVVSGGHTELYLMKSAKELAWLGGTLDDAAGEAFDKTARLLGFGTGGGTAIQQASVLYRQNPVPYQFKLPRPMLQDNSLSFSFSGLKTAIVREWKKYDTHPESLTNAFAQEVQESITDVLVSKTIKAVSVCNARSVIISGGVSANLRLREKFTETLEKSGTAFHSPPISLCTDNAAYIAGYAFFRGKPISWRNIEAEPDLSVEIDQ